MAEGASPDLTGQKSEIAELIKRALHKGETWYLLDTRWFKQWKKYVGFDAWDNSYVGTDKPGPVDNSQLFKDGTNELKEHLIDELDYVLLPVEGWEKLIQWYSIAEDQEAIARKVIEQGMFVKHCKVEVYLMDLKLCENSDVETVITKQFSRADTTEDLEREMRRLFDVAEGKEVRLWNRYMSNTYEHLSKSENTLQDTGLYQGQVIVIEQQNEDGTWPRQAKSTSSYNTTGTSSMDRGAYTSTRSYSNSSGYDTGGGGSVYGTYGYGSSTSYDSGRDSAAPGLCGLANLGNTCFMNSALQCLSSVPSLTEYMMNDTWIDELNADNPLGMKGEIAKSYADLIKHIWSGKYSYMIPRNFKVAVGRFAPQFSGYQQQDSQELMAFLLDGLHEDLNRIKKKPYIELNDQEGRPDEEVAQEAWQIYVKRNDSVIVDTFHGLLKSTLVCPECNKVSVTFDPFCYLSLPLPQKLDRQIEAFFVPLDAKRKLIQFKLTVPKLGIVSDICTALSTHTAVPADNLVVTDVYNHRFYKLFANDDALSHILDRDDIFVYEVPVNTSADPNTIVLPVYLRTRRIKSVYSANSYMSPPEMFGHPLLVPVPRNKCTYQQLYQAILKQMQRYVKVPETTEQWWLEDSKIEEIQMNGDMDISNGEDEVEGIQTDGLDNGTDKTGVEPMATSSASSSSPSSPSSSFSSKVPGRAIPASASSSHQQHDSEGNIIVDGKTSSSSEAPPQLFELAIVNSSGSAEMSRIQDNDKPLKLTSRTYIAVDWHPKAKDKFYVEKLAEEFDTHPSVDEKRERKHVIQLKDCLDLFTTCERLGENDPWYCPQCKKHQQATKKFDLWSLPNTLVIHLKRFSYSKYWRDKIDAVVEFPAKGLSLKTFLLNPEHGPAVYDLIAVSNHYGGMGGGHYTAYAKNKDDNEWYYFDDSSVSQSTEEAVVTKAAYVLVYQRRDPSKLHGPPVMPKSAAAAAAAAYIRNHSGSSNGTNGEYSGSNEEEMETEGCC